MTDFGGALRGLSQFSHYKIGIFGVPFDEKSSYRRGSAEGPRAIREASTGKCYNPFTEQGVDLENDTVMVDLGDVDTSGDADKTFLGIEKAILGILNKGAVPFILGGDHSITYPVLKAFSKKYRVLDILHFDAHPDLYNDLYGDRLSHACPLARILDDGLARTLVQVGIRAATPGQREKASRYGVRMIEMADIDSANFLQFKNPLYLSFDLDVLDPAFAPGVSHREAGGLSTRQAIRIIQGLKARIIGLDVVELNPSQDPAGITAPAAFKIIKEVAGKIVLAQNTRTGKKKA
jgi:agmatinase